MGNIDFKLAVVADDAHNAVRCSGQEIALPEGHRWLWLLATAAGPAITATFSAGDDSLDQRIASWTGWLSERPQPKRWAGLVGPRPGSLERDALAWVGTHRHRWRRGGAQDEPYVFCYLYRYLLRLAPSATSLRLPDAPSIRLFAATLSEPTAQARPALPLYG
jgi:hypothetical protein